MPNVRITAEIYGDSYEVNLEAPHSFDAKEQATMDLVDKAAEKIKNAIREGK